MTVSAELQKQREELENRFLNEVTWREGTVDLVPLWYDRLLSDLVLAAGPEPIRYFSAKYVPSADDAPGSMSVVAFTDALVAYADLDGLAEADMAGLEVSVVARRTLSGFSLETLGDEEGASIRVTVRYPGFSRSLPLGASDWQDREGELAQLIAHLRRDLAA